MRIICCYFRYLVWYIVHSILYPLTIHISIIREMAKTLKIDKSSEMVTIELDKNELKRILDSIDLMIQDQKRKLLETLPSDESDRKQLEVYDALREAISKAWRSI